MVPSGPSQDKSIFCKKSLKSITIRTLLNVIALAPTAGILIITMVSLDHPDPYDTEKAEL